MDIIYQRNIAVESENVKYLVVVLILFCHRLYITVNIWSVDI